MRARVLGKGRWWIFLQRLMLSVIQHQDWILSYTINSAHSVANLDTVQKGHVLLAITRARVADLALELSTSTQ